MSRSSSPLSRRNVLLAASSALASCRSEEPAQGRASDDTPSLARMPRLRQSRHGAGLLVSVPLGPIQANCYVLVDTTSSAAVVVDPGGEAEAIARYARESGWSVSMILATHGHIDHVAAVVPLARLLKVPFAMHAGDTDNLARLPQSGRMYGYPGVEVPTIDVDLRSKPSLAFGGVEVRVVPTPGHSPGSCCFHLPAWRIVLTGDTLFRRSVGRTDLPGGSPAQLTESIRRELYVLDDDVVAYCGHEEPTTIGEERRLNPFVR